MSVALVTGGSGGIGAAVVFALREAGWEVYAPTHTEMDVLDVPACRSYLVDKPALDAVICCHAAPIGKDETNTILVDVAGTISLLGAVVPGMVVRKAGRVVLFSSIRAHAPRRGQLVYAASKAAIEGLTRGLAVEFGPVGVLVNCIAPGAVMTPRTRANIAAGIVSETELIARTPIGRLVTAAEVAQVALWLASSDCPPTVTGQIITVDGGSSVQG